MRLRYRISTICLLGFFLIQSLGTPTTLVKASSTTNFDIGDSFNFTMNNFDMIVKLNGIDHINSSDYTFYAIGEPMDVTITDIGVIDIDTSESNVSVNVDFQNPDINDPIGESFTYSKSWDDHFQFAALLSELLISNFNPQTAIFDDTILIEDDYFVNPALQPANTSLLFPYYGGEIMPFFVDNDNTTMEAIYSDYLSFWEELGAPGTPDDGYYNRTSAVDTIGSDETNRTEIFSLYVSWDNESKQFQYDYGFEELYYGTFNNKVNSFYAHSKLQWRIFIDFAIGLVRFYDQALEIDYSVDNQSYNLIYNFGFSESNFEDPNNPTSETSSRSIITSTSTSTLTRPNTTESISSMTTSASSDTHDPRVNFSSPLIMVISITILQSIYRRSKK